MTYGTPAYGGLINTGKARENRAERHSPGRVPVLVPLGCPGCLLSPQVPGPAACVLPVPAQRSFSHTLALGDQKRQLTGASSSTPKPNFSFCKYIIKAHSHNYKILFHLSEGGGLAGAGVNPIVSTRSPFLQRVAQPGHGGEGGRVVRLRAELRCLGRGCTSAQSGC